MMKNAAALLAVFFLAACNSQVLAAGKSGAAFLRIPVGARPSALGEAYAGVSGDLETLHWNPAGLAALNDVKISASYARWLEDINYQGLTIGTPLASGYFALGVNLLAAGDMERFDSDGFATTGAASAGDMLVILSYARELAGFSVAPAVKYIYSKLDDESASGLGVDIGVQRETGSVNLGLALKNLGPGIKYRKESDPLPLNLMVGAVMPFYFSGFQLTGLTDISFSRDVSFKANAGAELAREMGSLLICFRAGFKLYAEKLDPISRLSLGGGLKFNNFSIDYGFSPYGDLGTAHRLSSGFVF